MSRIFIVSGYLCCQLFLVATMFAAGLGSVFAEDVGKSAKPEVTIDGVEGRQAENVRALLRLAAEQCDGPPAQLRRLFDFAEADIAEALRPFGYYAPRVEKHFSVARECWSARFTIEKGPRLTWNRVDIQLHGEAAGAVEFNNLLAKHSPRVGEPVDHAEYESVKNAIQLLAARLGYRDGRFTSHQLRVDPASGTAEAILHYDSGQRYRFGEINFAQRVFDPDLVKGFTRLLPGDAYDSAAIARLQRDLLDSGLFSGVEVRPDYAASADKRIPVHVGLTPRKRYAYLAGIGLTTDEGPRVRLGYENRRINRRGHSGEFALRASSVRGNVDFSYNVPLADPRSERLVLQAGYQRDRSDDTDSDLYKAGIRYIKRQSSDLVRTLFLELNEDQFEAGGDRGKSTLLMPGIAWDWRGGDKLIHPKRGWRVALELKGASRSMLSDVDFFSSYLSIKRIAPFLGGRVIGRAEVGYSRVGDFNDLPPSQRFFAGGDNSVRGYGYRDLGPRDEEGNVVGGLKLFTGSLEYDYPLADKWSVAWFADAGDAFDGSQIRLHHAIGMGLRWHSPVGAIRVDLAHPLDSDEKAFRFHISLGPDL